LNLWHKVRPNGGIYVIEDLYHSFSSGIVNDDKESIGEYIGQLLYLLNSDSDKLIKMGFSYLKEPIVPENAKNISQELHEVHSGLLSINCYYHA
jgi:hypothetical protein